MTSKFLIVLEEHFIRDSAGNIWSKRVINDEFLKRYTSVFDEVIIFARIANEEPKVNDMIITLEKVSFEPIPEFKGPKGLLLNANRIRKKFKKVLSKVDGVIMRVPSPLSLFLIPNLPKNFILGIEFMMGADRLFDGDSFAHKMINKSIDRFTKKTVLRANGVAYVTKEHLQKTYPSRASLYGEDKEYFTTNYSSIDLSKDFFYERKREINNPIILVELAFMDSLRKGQDILLKAAKLLISRGYNIKVKLIGDGNERDYFENLTKELSIQDRVEFTGSIIEKNYIRQHLIDSDIFVLPSKSEGLPRVLIEAMATGLPIVASNVDGIPELVEETLMVDRFDYVDYANTIEKLLTDSDFLLRTQTRNYELSKAYEKSALQEKRKDFYKKLSRISKRDS